MEIWHRVAEMIRDAYTYIFYYHTNWAIGVRDNVNDVCGQNRPMAPNCCATTRDGCSCTESG